MLIAIDYIPIKRRAKAVVRNGRIMTYVDDKTREEMEGISAAWRKHPTYKKVTGKARVEIDVYPRLPDSKPKRMESEPFCIKPDADNIAKCVLDALNGIAFDDDAAVTTLIVRKHDRKRCDKDMTRISVTEDADE